MRAVVLMLLLSTTCASAQQKVAFFGLTMLDTSLQTATQGDDPAQAARLAALEDMARDRFRAEGFAFVDLTPEQTAIDRVANPAKCYGCDTRIAARLGADFSLVGEVQKVSNLILTINLQLREASTGTLVKGGVVDIRGNTDESWSRGMRYILNNRIFREE